LSAAQGNPFTQIDSDEQRNILDHLRNYHAGPMNDKPSFNELANYFPRVLNKITGNLNCYINDLENSDIIIYQSPTGNIKIDVSLKNETVWLTQKLMAELFQTTAPNINAP
jgi:hypothetical protein